MTYRLLAEAASSIARSPSASSSRRGDGDITWMATLQRRRQSWVSATIGQQWGAARVTVIGRMDEHLRAVAAGRRCHSGRLARDRAIIRPGAAKRWWLMGTWGPA